MTPKQIPKDFWLYESNNMTVGPPGGFFCIMLKHTSGNNDYLFSIIFNTASRISASLLQRIK